MRRIIELDALRGLAAVAIVIYHLWIPHTGFLGTAVDLFFVLSGYLITSIILKQREHPRFLLTFYARRSLRIWPIYYLSLLALVAWDRVVAHPAPLDGLPYYLTYTQNIQHYWFGAEPPFSVCFRHTWSLAIEEQFYLIWPLLLVVLGRKALVPIASSLILVSVLARMAGYSRWILLTRCDGLAMGGILAAVLAEVEEQTTSRRMIRTLALIGVGATLYLAQGATLLRGLERAWGVAAPPVTALSLRMLMVNLMYGCVIGLVVLLSGHRWLAPLRDRRLCYLGQLSYGIYLYHHIIIESVRKQGSLLGLSGAALEAMLLVASFGLAALSWRFVERPLLTLKDRLGYPSGTAPNAVPAPEIRAQVPHLESALRCEG
jgi:peptidoglycan/LPS O-acetylase OafA/YrhL